MTHLRGIRKAAWEEKRGRHFVARQGSKIWPIDEWKLCIGRLRVIERRNNTPDIKHYTGYEGDRGRERRVVYLN